MAKEHRPVRVNREEMAGQLSGEEPLGRRRGARRTHRLWGRVTPDQRPRRRTDRTVDGVDQKLDRSLARSECVEPDEERLKVVCGGLDRRVTRLEDALSTGTDQRE